MGWGSVSVGLRVGRKNRRSCSRGDASVEGSSRRSYVSTKFPEGSPHRRTVFRWYVGFPVVHAGSVSFAGRDGRGLQTEPFVPSDRVQVRFRKGSSRGSGWSRDTGIGDRVTRSMSRSRVDTRVTQDVVGGTGGTGDERACRDVSGREGNNFSFVLDWGLLRVNRVIYEKFM